MKKSALFAIILIFSLVFSCATRSVVTLERSLMTSNVIYNDIAPQVNSALESSLTNSVRGERLQIINQKLDEYAKSYGELSKAVESWRISGEAPDNTEDLYLAMWTPLIEAQTLAATLYIYASECTARTTLKGKAGNNCF